MKLLHIIASPRGKESRTLKVSASFLKELNKKHPEYKVEELNLFKEKLPKLTTRQIDGKYVLLGGKDLPVELKSSWKKIIRYINEFLSADSYLISTPMWNFSIPYILKQYIDIIVQPKYFFKYTGKGVEGLVKNKKMIVITSRGGDYSFSSTMHAYDLQEIYLRTIFGFVGINEISFINAQPMDAQGSKVQEDKILQTQHQARELAQSI